METWMMMLIFGVCSVVVVLYLIKRVQKKHAPITDKNEFILGESSDGSVVKKGQTDDD